MCEACEFRFAGRALRRARAECIGFPENNRDKTRPAYVPAILGEVVEERLKFLKSRAPRSSPESVCVRTCDLGKVVEKGAVEVEEIDQVDDEAPLLPDAAQELLRRVGGVAAEQGRRHIHTTRKHGSVREC